MRLNKEQSKTYGNTVYVIKTYAAINNVIIFYMRQILHRITTLRDLVYTIYGECLFLMTKFDWWSGVRQHLLLL